MLTLFFTLHREHEPRPWILGVRRHSTGVNQDKEKIRVDWHVFFFLLACKEKMEKYIRTGVPFVCLGRASYDALASSDSRLASASFRMTHTRRVIDLVDG